MDVIPAIDVLGGQAVRLLRGDYDAITVYNPDPLEVATTWRAAGARIIHVVDLEAARGGDPTTLDLIRRMVEVGVSCQIGGGIRTPAHAAAIVQAGADRVVVGSAFVDANGLGEEITKVIGPDNVVAAIDVRDGFARGHGWTAGGVPYEKVVERTLMAGVRRMLVTGIDVDGTMEGPDFELLAGVAAVDQSIRLIASGGVGSLNDIAVLKQGPAEAVIVGRALYEDRFTLEEAIDETR